MNILHYFLGFPPYRTGGMTKFAMDLIQEGVTSQHNVTVLWPGTLIKIGGKPKIKKRNSIYKINNYELINPLPVPLDEGIINFEAFMKSCDISIYISFFNVIKPDVIHIHTLMGLHKEFIEAANILGIKIIFTSHDYFGICPKVTLYRNGECCDNDDNCKKCIQCNLSALSLNKIRLLQSPLYRIIKNSKIITKLRKIHRNKFYSEDILLDRQKYQNEDISKKYIKLRAYYINILESINIIHFNSHLAEKIYRRYITPQNSIVISLSHQEIMKNKIFIKKQNKKMIFLYLGPTKSYKGFGCLKIALDNIWKVNKNFELRIFNSVEKPSSYMVIKESGYQYSELPTIMKEADLLIAPSICYETFGFTVLEALSFGVPVLVSNHVGAQDIIGNAGIIFSAGNISELQHILENLTIKNLNILRRNTCDLKIKTWEQFVNELFHVYQN